jgi:hypothetical protein
MKRAISIALAWAVLGTAQAGPYSLGIADASNAFDAPVPGFVGPNGDGQARLDDGFGGFINPENYVNPLFFGWADQVSIYAPTPGVGTSWSNPSLALGPVTGDNFDIVSLGDLDATQIGNGITPGEITLMFLTPLRNFSGADLVIFENGIGSATSVFAELAYVEISSDGVNFARFPSKSLTASAVGGYGNINPTDAFNLAGKHVNANGECWGTPFEFSQLAADPLVTGGQVDLNAIRYVRLVDIPGSGDFKDSENRSIFDAWLTFGSGGFDLEAVGVVSRPMTFAGWQTQRGLVAGQTGENADPDGDGIPNLLEYAFARIPTIADNASPTTALAVASGRLQIAFQRDERATDLTYEVQASDDLSTWTTIARSSTGQPFAGVNGFSPAITETSASPIASVGVLRKVEVNDVVDLTTKPRRFLRVRVVESP